MNDKSTLTKATAIAQRDAVKSSAKSKRAYEKPGFIYQAPLEAMAAVCSGNFGKASGHCSVASS